MQKTLDHIGIAVRDIDEALNFYVKILGGKVEHRYTSEAPGVEVHVAAVRVDGELIELLQPTSNTSPVARFIRQKGKGVHHVAYRVDDLDQAIEEAEQQGIRFLKDTYRTNQFGRRLIYLNPISTEGTIVEFCDYPDQSF
ncbi:VOC family protein [Bacillus sp. Marseille-Q3570]|uniref:VOC family protein n=1 Tax=Bacillus sp. Marseille-Q3570 TaxID=2963522 RepID=UPI0021B77549|nr:VOC family protein [Bacillus sp. Marseille-Q3570]